MPNFKKLDDQYRLTPWNDAQHAAYVAGQYGAMLGQGKTAKAEIYVKTYRQKEIVWDATYEKQKEYFEIAPVQLGTEPQELPELVKIDWDPTKRFAKEADKPKKVEKVPVEEEKVEEKAEEKPIEKPKADKPKKA